jgi:hypothetical protein
VRSLFPSLSCLNFQMITCGWSSITASAGEKIPCP